MRYIIVGGVAAGASFACRLRRLDEFAEILIYEKTNFVVSFAMMVFSLCIPVASFLEAVIKIQEVFMNIPV